MVTMTRGFLTLELIISIALFATIMTAALLVATGGQVASMDVGMTEFGLASTTNKTQALSQTASVHQGFQSLVGSVVTGDGFRLSTLVDTLSPCMKYVEASTTWSSDKGRSLFSSSGTFVISTTTTKAMGGGCSPLPPAEGWENPGSLGSVDVSGADGTGVDARWVAGHRYVFLTGDPSSAGKEDLYVFNADTPTAPVLTAALNTGKGLNDVVVADGYAFVVQNDKTNQLQVIDVSNPAAPVFVTSLSLPGVLATGSYPEGRTITYWNKRVYIGTKETAGPEFHVIDVSTPTSPVHLGSLEVTHNVNDIVVRGTTAYLATSADCAELMLINVSNPGAMTLPQNCSTPGTMDMKFNARTTGATPSESTEDGITLDVVGPYVFLGRERASASDERDWYVIDVTDPNALTAQSALRLGLGPNTEVSGIVTRTPYSFVMTTDSNKPLYVVRVTDVTSPVVVSSCSFNYSQVTRAISYLDNYIFSANRSNDILRIIYDKPGVSCS